MGLFGDITDSLGITQGGANKAHGKQTKGIQQLFAQLSAQQAQLGGLATMNAKKGLKSIKQGYGNALANSGLQATNAIKNVQAQGQQQQGAALQSLLSRGLSNTTALDNAVRGINADTTSATNDISAALAALQSNLHAGQGAAEAGQYDFLTQLLQQQGGAATGLGLQKAGYLFGSSAGTPYNASGLAPGGVNQLFQYLPFLFGSPGGGGASAGGSFPGLGF